MEKIRKYNIWDEVYFSEPSIRGIGYSTKIWDLLLCKAKVIWLHHVKNWSIVTTKYKLQVYRDVYDNIGHQDIYKNPDDYFLILSEKLTSNVWCSKNVFKRLFQWVKSFFKQGNN